MSWSEVYGEERELLPISALQHLVYCERRAALIHVEREWRENAFTAEGRVDHLRVDHKAPRRERRDDVVTRRGIAVWSLKLGLIGYADVVEFRQHASGVPIPYPVEYKRGRPKRELAYEVQLCAQALCLEEMFKCTIPFGALLFTSSRKRLEIAFSPELRQRCMDAVHQLHVVVSGLNLPKSVPGPKCRKCSMNPVCMPAVSNGTTRVGAYLAKALVEV